MNKNLRTIDKSLKIFLSIYIIVITIGVTIGLSFVRLTTSMTPKGTIERFKGSEDVENSDFEIKENYPKPISEMLLTTHNHILGLSFIFLSIGLIFYFNSIIKGFWKTILMIEPLISVVVSFGSIWLMRFVHQDFVYLTIISAILMYLSFYIMAFVSLLDLRKTF